MPPVPQSSIGLDATNTPQPALGATSASESLVGGFSQVTVGQTDTLYSLSRRYGISERNILAANSLNKPSDIQSGQRILVPPVSYRPGDVVPSLSSGSNGSSGNSITTTQLPAPAAPRIPTSYTVQQGDTLYGIARQNNVDAKELARANNLSSPNSIRVGQRLAMPGAESANSPRRTTVTQTQQSMTTAVPTTRPSNINPSNQRVASIGANDAQTVPVPTARPAYQSDQIATQRQTSSAPATTPTRVASARPTGHSGPLPDPDAMSSSQFRWPVRGRVISNFGSKSNGAKNDGINIAVPAGTSIKAAENGVVAYAGNELEGYGNLILIRHENDWVTAYAHSSRILVQRGDKVRRGQIIAQAGQSGSVDRPQLHFELRQGSRPIDPAPHMSGS